MSGHSKWSQIKHKKALTDKKKSNLFGKVANIISVASRTGEDPAMNPNLRLAIEKARAIGMPNDNIQRAIERGAGKTNEAQLQEISYEAYGPAGVGIIIEAITDNPSRTLGEIRAVLNRHGGHLAQTGAVSYNFEKHNVTLIPKYKIEIADKNKQEQAAKLLQVLEDLDDVSSVYCNLK